MRLFYTWIAIIGLVLNCFATTTYNEFYSLAGGSNLNAGSTTATAAVYTAVNGNWSAVTGAYIPTDGSTPASTVSAGMWASVYVDGATVGVYIGQVTTVAAGVNGQITVSLTAGAGAAPTTSATARSIKIGGAHLGPNAASGFPFTLANLLRLTNSSVDRPRFNLKNDQEYKITAAISCSANGPFVIEGYTTTPGDGGRAQISGNTAAAAFVPLSFAGNFVHLKSLILSSNGNSSTASAGLIVNGNQQIVEQVVINNMRGSGFFFQGAGQTAFECEAYSNGVANAALEYGFRVNGGSSTLLKRCVSHYNRPSSVGGFLITSSAILDTCIADSNGTNGITLGAGVIAANVTQTEVYNNGGSGIEIKGSAGTDAGLIFIENCNFVKNVLWGINIFPFSSNRVGVVQYCGFGSGSQANGSGTVATTGWGAVSIRDSTFVTYASGVTPWVAPTTGDFRINNAQAWNTGRGAFVETQGGYSGTVGYPDIGAADHLDVTNATSSVFSQ